MFDCVPSNLPELYWKYTRNDFKVKLRLYLGCSQARIVQDYQSLAKVVSEAFGGSTQSKVDENTLVPKTKEEMQAAFKGVFG